MIRIVSERERNVRRFNIVGREFLIRVNEDDDNLTFGDFAEIFQSILDHILSGFEPSDMVGIEISFDGLNSVIYYPFTRMDQITLRRLLDIIEKVIQSNMEVRMRNIEIKVIRVKLPLGGGHLRGLDMSTMLKRKRCLISVSGIDNLCFGRCLALALCESSKEFKKLYNNKNRLTSEAKKLYTKAGISFKEVGLPELECFQMSLPKYQILVYNDKDLIFKGCKRENQIYFMLYDNHYYLIKSMKAFLCRSYFCKQCLRGYSNTPHRCAFTCMYCSESTICTPSDYHYCENCNRVFPSTKCYTNHRENKNCEKYVTCNDCCKIIERNSLYSHNCRNFTCTNCKNSVKIGHKCYITQNVKNREMKGPIIVFDCEAVQSTGIHEINLIVSKRICMNCVISFSTELCQYCEEKTFNNTSEFCRYVFTDRNKNAVCVSHYGRAYDTQFIARYLLENGKTPFVTATGTKYLCLEYKGIRFLDSHTFIPMKLADIPKCFGFAEDVKGYFPHLFNTWENQNYVGPIPDIKYYDPDGMFQKNRSAFMTWHAAQTSVFDMKKELLRYCKNDVEILVKAIVRFRKLFYELSSLDPFTCITLAQACLEVYRMKFMPPNSIGIIMDEKNRNFSILSIKWLKWLEQDRTIKIQHALNGSEMKIGPYNVDGVCGKTLFEFYGCRFHGCPKCYRVRDICPFGQGLTFHELFQRTISRELYLKKLGYTVESIWECEFEMLLKNNLTLKLFCDSLPLVEPINPRDSLFGGRVEVFSTFYVGEINYIDVTSLYPYVNKNCNYPIGHPKIITSNFLKDPTEYFGLIKCKILPPKNLYIPLLPSRIDNKLLFVLCKTCGAKKQVNCNHSENKRCLMGTWTTLELFKALQLGYKIMEIYEVWHFEDQMTGLFGDYVNKFLKIKQESSGWPPDCNTDAEKCEYLRQYKINEGIDLDSKCIEKNPGKRSISKLILNSLWGKIGQRSNLPDVEFVDNAEKLYKLFETREISSIDIMNDRILKVVHKSNIEELSFRNSAVIASFTTSHARLILYSYMEKIQRNVLYTDTDSIIYKGPPVIPLSNYLGGMTNEVGNGLKITKFIGISPKSYGYQCSDGSSVLKVKGITLNYRSRQIINLELMEEMISDRSMCATVQIPFNICRTKDCRVVTKKSKKNFSMMFDKRCLSDDHTTLPWGYI